MLQHRSTDASANDTAGLDTAGLAPGMLNTAKPSEALTTSLDSMKIAIELSPVAALLIARDGGIQMANAAAHQLFGHAQLVGMSVDRLVPSDVQGRHSDLRASFHERPAHRKMAADRNLYARHANGNLLPVEIGLRPVSIDDTACSYVSILDLSPRQKGQARLRDAMNAAGAAIVMVDKNGMIELVNNAACALLGGTAAALVGTGVDDYVPAVARDAHARYRQSVLSNVAPHAMAGGRPLSAVARDGRETPVEITLNPIYFDDGPHVLATLVDISGRLAHEREMKARNDHLAALNEELTQFAYSASHDLRAPLATISGLLELCLEDLDDDETEECRHNINEALKTSRRNIRKVEAVLTLARAGLAPVPVEPFDLPATIAACWDDVSGDGRPKPAMVIDIDGPSIICTERQTIATAIENLLSNACRFQDPDKSENWVQVRIRTRGDSLSLLVSDNGIGIPQDEQPRIFDMFRRSAKSSGHGLGLALVQKNVLRLGGNIALSSTPARTDFILTFPGMEIPK